MTDEFFVRCNCANRRFTGGKIRDLRQASRWRKKAIRQMCRRINQEIPQRKIYNLHIYRHGFFMIQ